MEHRHLPAQAVFDLAAIVEGLYADVSYTDAIGVVAMPRVGVAAEPGAHELDALERTTTTHPVARVAQTFKTFDGRRV